ncbi:MAG: hypothetical protein PHG08_00140 [Bacilli bacterium]|nr:hypothetical protein [Bacilli bacterium]
MYKEIARHLHIIKNKDYTILLFKWHEKVYDKYQYRGNVLELLEIVEYGNSAGDVYENIIDLIDL